MWIYATRLSVLRLQIQQLHQALLKQKISITIQKINHTYNSMNILKFLFPKTITLVLHKTVNQRPHDVLFLN